MGERDGSNIAALLEESSEGEILAILRSEVGGHGPPIESPTAVRDLVLAIVRRSLPAVASEVELLAITDELLPALLSHERTRVRLERLVGACSREGRGEP